MLELFELSSYSYSVRRNEGSERGNVYFRGGRAAAKEISQGNKKAAQRLSVGRSGGDGVVK